MPDRPILLSAGGTGGHLFPAEALAEELVRRGRRVVIVTDKRGHAFRSLGPAVPVHSVRAATLKPGIAATLRALALMSAGVVQALGLIFKYRPAVIVGFGGYPSFPAVFAGQVLRVPTILHEQNAILGKANAVLARRATRIAAALPDTRGIAAATPVTVTGNPVRAPILAVREAPYAPPGDTIHLLITGGSQGASIFSTVIPAAIALLPAELRARLSVTHQCRAAETAAARGVYDAAGVRVEIAPFFNDMAGCLARCHLFIGRSGASTVAEIAVAGRPAIFVPFLHKDRQQVLNAETLSRNGGVFIIEQPDLTPAVLAQKLRELLEDPAILARMAASARACGRPDATQRLADLVESRI